MDNSGGARRSKFSPNENANDEEYEIKSEQWEAAAGTTRTVIPTGRVSLSGHTIPI